MDIEPAREYCLSKKAVTECFPFDEYSLVMKVMDKMFALIDLESANKICLKCDPEYALELRERYAAIEGAYHFNKKYWNQVFLDGDVMGMKPVPRDMLKKLFLEKAAKSFLLS